MLFVSAKERKGAEISSHRGGGGAGGVSKIFSVAKATPEILVHGH